MSNLDIFLQLRDEVSLALDLWSKFLQELGVKYAYVKGSSIKLWETEIDYVPIISDVDIHYRLDDGLDLNKSLGLSLEYEKQFMEKNPHAIHIPRIQLINLSKFVDNEQFISPLQKQIQILFGEVKLFTYPDPQFIKSIDFSQLQELEKVIEMIPEMVIDRQGIELWTAVRRMSWRVSPTPVRILTQILDDPLEIWTLNRTEITRLLKQHDFHLLSELYQAYYHKGWELFRKGLIDTKISLEMVNIAKDLFIAALRIVDEVITKSG